jgi:diguanylate cyclase (GGDEF)-like protein
MKLVTLKKEIPIVSPIIEAIQDPFFILSPQGAILLSNPKGMELFGASWEELRQTEVLRWVAPEDRNRVRRELEEMEEGKEIQLRIHILHRSQGEIPADFFLMMRGEVCFVTLRDLRDQMRTEEDWNRTKREFADRARERDQYARELQVMRDLYKEKLKEIRDIKEKIEVLSYTDELTGICNRRFFIHVLTLEVERQKRYPCPLSLLMIDIDYFKHYNDTNGHLAGDQVLKAISGLIEGAVRQTDVVARYGGEEFSAILINAGREEAIEIAERVRKSVANSSFPNERAQPDGKLTVSLGVATFSPIMTTPDAFIREADNALYRAKRAGRNRVEV